MGRGPAVALGLCAQLAGLILIIAADGLTLMVAGGVLVAIGMAMIGATTTALAIDLSDQKSRGRAMATYSISYQLGAGIGAIVAGALADLVGLRGMYVGSAVITVCGLMILATAWQRLPQPSR